MASWVIMSFLSSGCHSEGWNWSVAEPGAVDPAVEAHPGEPAEDRADQGGGKGDDDGDDRAGGHVAAPDGQAWEAAEPVEDVVLVAEHGTRDRDHGGDDDGPDPHGEALLDAAEAGHAAGDITAAEVRDEDDDQQCDAADDSDAAGLLPRLFLRVGGVDAGADADRGAGGDQQSGQDDRGAGGGQPAEEGRAPFDA